MKNRKLLYRIINKITIISVLTACIGLSSGCSCARGTSVVQPPVVTESPVAPKVTNPPVTDIPADSPTSVVAPTSTSTPTPTNTPEPTSTPEPTNTPVPTDTPTPAATSTPTSSPTPTDTPTPAATSTPTSTPVPTDTPTPNVTSEVVENYTSLDDIPVPGLFETTDITSTYKIVIPDFFDKVEFKVDESTIKSLYTSSDSEDIAIDIVYTLNTNVETLYKGYHLNRPDEIVLEERTDGLFVHTEAVNVQINGALVGLSDSQDIPAVMSVIYRRYGVGTDFPVPAVHFFIYKVTEVQHD